MPTVPYEFRFRVTDWMAAMLLIPLDRLALVGMMRMNRLHTIYGPEDERFSQQQLALFAVSAAFAFGAGYLAMRLATQRQVGTPWKRAAFVAAGNLALLVMFLGAPVAMALLK